MHLKHRNTGNIVRTDGQDSSGSYSIQDAEGFRTSRKVSRTPRTVMLEAEEGSPEEVTCTPSPYPARHQVDVSNRAALISSEETAATEPVTGTEFSAPNRSS